MIRILLIEDDDVSRAFLAEALGGAGSVVLSCRGFTDALRHCACERFDLIVSDIHLGDGSLYDMAARLPAGTPVLATSAALDADTRERLRRLGIKACLGKPAGLAEIREACTLALGDTAFGHSLPLLDEQRALKALAQNHAALASLKALFKAELPDQAERIAAAVESRDRESAQAVLHKLKASCGFLGAARLLDACYALDAQPDKQRLGLFQQAVTDTLAIL